MKNVCYLFLLISMGLMAQEKVTAPSIAVKIELGKTVDFGDYKVTFSKMINDSRCPKDVECVWAGEAKIMVKIEEPNGNMTVKSVTISPAKSSEIISGKLDALDLKPYPNAFKVEGKPYTLLVKKRA